ncbi:MAG: DUF6340 family protein [Myxococcota bacterium]
MIWLVGTLACVPRVEVEWSTRPDVVSERLRTLVVEASPGTDDVARSLRETLAVAGWLSERCGPDGGILRLLGVRSEERELESAVSTKPMRFVLPSGEVRQEAIADPWVSLTWQGRVHLTWKLERCDGQVVESVGPVTVAGARTAGATEALRARAGLPEGLLEELRVASGQVLARRFVRSRGRVRRPWFKRGDPRLRLASQAVREGHWDAAAATWQTVVNDPSAPAAVHGRAHHDLAVFHEIHGRTARALEAVQRAEHATAHSRIRRYRIALEGAWTDSSVLRPYSPLEAEEKATP